MILGLLGYPLTHSLSPKIHTTALAACGIQGCYDLFPLMPDNLGAIRSLLDRIHSGEITGLNVTIPFKQSVIPFLDELSPTARSIGAVNTLSLKKNILMGDNTDAHGFLADLKRFLNLNIAPEKQTKRALVLGAGGAARAVVFALANDGWNMTIAARRLDQAGALIDQFQEYRAQLAAIPYNKEELEEFASNVDLVINTTPVGMAPNVEESPWLLGAPFPTQADFYDLVYNPPETKFIRDARAAGYRVSSGIGMLVEQAALSFKIWTGYDISRELLFSTLEDL